MTCPSQLSCLSHKIDRRHFLAAGIAATVSPVLARADSTPTPVVDVVNAAMTKFMEARSIPGGALAVIRHGALIHARGYGVADEARKLPVRADSLFRIASLSKPITALAILKLAEQKKLNLDDPFLARLSVEPVESPDTGFDKRLRAITIRNLLQHTGGWDRDRSFDPMFRSCQIAKVLRSPGPASAFDVIRYMLGQPLDFNPGERYAYSNFGYCLLGRIIEAITGESYESYVRARILQPLGIRKMRMGSSLEQAPGEVRYYTPKAAPVPSVFDCESEPHTMVAPAYGGFCLESMDAHGGWIASVLDLMRLAAALDVAGRRAPLQAETMKWMIEPPSAPAWRRAENGALAPAFYGCGWMVRPLARGGANTWHAGSLPGTATMIVRRADGISWAAFFNQRSRDRQLPDTDIDPQINKALTGIDEWPDGSKSF